MANGTTAPSTVDPIDRPLTPTLPTPVGSKTPPTITSKRFAGRDGNMSAVQRATEAMEADALNRRLKEFDHAGRQRERTPGRSPSRKRQRVYGDR